MADSISALERAETEAFADLYRAASARVVAACGVSVLDVVDATLLVVNRLDVLALNRLLGLGLEGRPSSGALAELPGALERAGAPRYFVPVAPLQGNEDLARRLEELGLRHYNNWMRLARRLDTVPDPFEGDLAIRRIDSHEAESFGTIVSTAFDYPPAIAPLASQTIGRSGWSHYLAYDRDVPVATAATYLAGDTAWFGFAATESSHRRRGAQRALIIRRLRDAAEAGCRQVSVETAEDTVTRDAPSFRNLRALGFDVAYSRPNYIWKRTEG